MASSIFGSVVTLFNNIGLAPSQVRSQCGKRVKSVAQHILDASQPNVPVDIGTLKASGHLEQQDSMNVDVVYDAADDREHHYSAYVELGTVRTRPQPFLMPAVEQHKDELKLALTDEGL